MFLRGGFKSRELTDASMLLSSHQRYRKQLFLWLGALVGLIVLGLAIRHFELNYVADPRATVRDEEIRRLRTELHALRGEHDRLSELSRSLRITSDALRTNNEELTIANEQFRVANDELRLAVERATLDLEIDAVTRAELERRIVVLSEQLKQAKEELEFVKAARKTR